MIQFRYGTPIERIEHIWVKRDDLVSEPPAPRLGKLRGIFRQIVQANSRTIGAVDRSATSRNAWAHAFLARELGLSCIAYIRGVAGENQEQARRLGAQIVRYDQSFSSVEEFYAAASRDFRSGYPEGYLATDDCFAPEIIAAAEDETLATGRRALAQFNSVVVPTSSGGLALGIVRGLRRLQLEPKIFIHRGGSRRSAEFLQKVVPEAIIIDDPFRSDSAENVAVSFPCNVTYERRALRWLRLQPETFRNTTLFWNAGA